MSILNEDSDSLVIAQGNNELDMNSLEENVPKEEDLFELSRDDLTLSFQIEQQKKNQMLIEVLQPLHEDNEKRNIQQAEIHENKRKRKDIFQKFKRPQTSIGSKLESINSEDNLLNIFDSIFKTKVPQSQVSPTRETQVNSNYLRPMTEIVDRSKTPSAEKRERLKIFGKKNNQREYQGLLPSDLLESQVTSFQPAKYNLVGSPILAKKDSDSINFSLIQNRLSGILNDENVQFSREELQIQNFLESEIFKDEEGNELQIVKRPIEKPIQELPIQKEFKMEDDLAVLRSQQDSPERKEIKEPVLPFVQQKKQQVVLMSIEQSRVLRSQTSFMSISPITLQAYQQSSSGGFKAQNSMANISSPAINDLTLKLPQNNKKLPNQIDINFYESQIIQSTPAVVKVNVFDSERRMPTFLRLIRQHISIYPNFYLHNSPNSAQYIKEEFHQLFNLFTEAIELLIKLCEKVLDIKTKKKVYLSQLANSMTQDFFLESGWENIVKKDEFDAIKPFEAFQARQWSYEKAKAALSNYQNIVIYYKNKGINIDTTSDKGKRKYFQVRQKFWDICGNMKLISQDIYSEMIDCEFPKHFYIFYEFLKKDFPNRLNDQTASYLKSILRQYKSLKSENDLLLNSEIGAKIKEKIDMQMKYVIPF